MTLALCGLGLSAQTPSLDSDLSAALRGTQATGVVLDFRTGTLLAHRGAGHASTPGSVIKPLLLSYALDHNIVRPETEVYCRRNLRIGTRDLACTHPADQPVFTAETALAESCNTWFAGMARSLTGEQLEAALRQTQLPHRRATYDTVAQRELTVLGLENVSVSPLQLARAYREMLQHAPASVLAGLKDSVDFGMAHPAAIRGLNRAPDGGIYQFAYEATSVQPSYEATTTGRIASITLPTGGTISYQYSSSTSNTNGINCSDGSVPTLTRTTSDGTSSFAQSANNGYVFSTTVTDEKQNQSVYSFQQNASGLTEPYANDRKIYQGTAGNSPPLEEVTTCYVSAATNAGGCSSYPPYTGPIGEIDTTTSFNGISPVTTKTTYDSTGTVVTNTAVYSGSTLLESIATPYTITPPTYELNSTTVQDGSGNTVAYTSYGYDENRLYPTSSLPQHVAAPGTRGNRTSTNVSIDGSTSNTLSTTIVFDDAGQPYSITTPIGRTTYSYESTDTFLTTTNQPPLQGGSILSTSATYDVASGVVTSTTGVNSGQTTSITAYDGYLRPTTVIPIAGQQISAVYHPVYGGAPAQSTTTQGSQSSITLYDGYGRKSRTANYNGHSNTAQSWYQQDFCYDAGGFLQFQSLPYAGPGLGSQANSQKQCSGAGMSYTYDALGRTLTTTSSDGTGQTNSNNVTAYTNYTGRAVQSIDVNNLQTITQYDLLGRVGGVCEVTQITLINSGSPSTCNATTTGSTATTGMDFSATGYSTTYAYNLAAHSTTITQGAQTRTFITDAAGRSTSVTEPERGTTTYAYSYNSTGLQLVRTRPAANGVSGNTTTTTQSDALGRPSSVTYSDGTPLKQFHYDQSSYDNTTAYNVGKLTSVQTNSGASGTWTEMNYDIQGNVSETAQCLPSHCGNGVPLVLATRQYLYDPVFGLTDDEHYDPNANGNGPMTIDTQTSYTPTGEVSSVTNSFNGDTLLSNVNMSVFGPSDYLLGNGLSGVMSYDGVGRATSFSVCNGSTSIDCSGGTQMYQTSQILRGGQVKAITDSVNGQLTATYDDFNRLTAIAPPYHGVHHGPTIGPASPSVTYTYDRYGNRWSQTLNSGSGTSPQLSFDSSNHITTPGYSYDAAGDLLSDGIHNYTYDAEGNVIAVDGGNTATYTYDAQNHRIRQTVPGTSDQAYVYNSTGQRSEIWDLTSSTPRIVSSSMYSGNKVLAMANDDGTFYMHQDLLGTKRLETDFNGDLAGSFTSLPFGDNFSTNSNEEDSQHFALLDHDQESSTEHAQFRQYSSNTGRWMGPDPYDGSYSFGNPQSLNRYVYALNNPLMIMDPSGLDCVYANDGGTGAEEIDHDSNSGECGDNGGSWVPGYADENWVHFNNKTGMFQVGSINGAGAGATVDYTVFGAGDNTGFNADDTACSGCSGFASANANLLQNGLKGNSLESGLDGYIGFLVGREDPVSRFSQIAYGPLNPNDDAWAGPGGAGPPRGTGDWIASMHDYDFATNGPNGYFNERGITIGMYFDPTLSLATSNALIQSNSYLMQTSGYQGIKEKIFFGAVNAFQWYANSWK